MYYQKSETTAEYIDNAGKSLIVPLHSYSAVSIVIPKARSRNIETAVCLLHDDAVGDVLKVFVNCYQSLENLDINLTTSSQITFDHTCASLML